MSEVTLKDVLKVIQRTINSVDNRLLDHGEQVGFICMRMGLAMGHTEAELIPLCSLATIHDIGAYKVEERKRLTEFEVDSPHEHAIYGSLFVRHFSPFPEAANTLLYHHWRYEDRLRIVGDRLIPPEAFLVNLADRVSVLFAHSGNGLKSAIEHHIPRLSGRAFEPQSVDLLMDLVRHTDLVDRIIDGSYMQEFHDFLGRARVTAEEAIAYLNTLVYAIDFRSPQTVTHSVLVATNALHIGELTELSCAKMAMLRHAALLHDVGKITTPLELHTKPGRLTDDEMDVMRRHVSVTWDVLSQAVPRQVAEIASNHHEKLNGLGYPRGLSADQLCKTSRILAVADVLPALIEPRYYKPALPKERVLDIMRSNADQGALDPSIVAVVSENYDALAAESTEQQTYVLALYDDISAEYDRLVREVHCITREAREQRRSILKAA